MVFLSRGGAWEEEGFEFREGLEGLKKEFVGDGGGDEGEV